MSETPERPSEQTPGDCMRELIRANEAGEVMKSQLKTLLLDTLRQVPGFPAERLNDARLQFNLTGKGFVIVNVSVEGLKIDDNLHDALHKIPGVKAKLLHVGAVRELEIVMRPDELSLQGGAIEAVAAATRDTAGQVQPGSH